MDSIGDNVMAIICVVVGILIIGCALVPIVDNASTVENEVTITTNVSGYNTPTSDENWIGPITELRITADGTTVTIDNETYTGTLPISLRSAISNSAFNLGAVRDDRTISVQPTFDGDSYKIVNPGLIVYADGTLTVSGTVNGNEYSHSMVTALYISNGLELSDGEETDVYAFMDSPFKIGEGQKCISSTGYTIVTMETETLPDNITMELNDDHTATITIVSGNWFGPYKWTGYTTDTQTVTSDSEYKALYGIIPVLCILGMAYVLIRRFY